MNSSSHIVSLLTILFKIATVIKLIILTPCESVNCSFRGLTPNVSLTVLCEDFDKTTHCSDLSADMNFTDQLNNIFIENQHIESVVIKLFPLWKIPEKLCSLKQLKELVIHDSCLNELPTDCFHHLSNLESLTIEGTEIKKLHEGLFDGLNKLKALNLPDNKIETIYDSVFSNLSDLRSLKDIDLRNNRLERIGPWPIIRGMSTPGFKADLSTNNITYFENKLGWIFPCNSEKNRDYKFQVNLRDNKIRHISDFVEAFFGNFTNFICMFGKKTYSNVKMDLDENTFWCDCKDYNIMKFMRTFTRINMIVSARCYGPEKLLSSRYLSINYEDLICEFTNTSLCVEGCRCIFQPHGKLYNIDCSLRHTSLTRLPDSIPPLKNVSNMTNFSYNISFAKNDISVLERRWYFDYSRKLDMSNTRLRSIDENAFQYLKSDTLQVINLQGNLLEILPKSVMNANWESKQVMLNGNPWNCNCENVWFKGWLSNISNSDSVFCSSPWWLNGRMIVKVEDHEFCEDPAAKHRTQVIIVSLVSAASVVLLVILVLFLLRRFKVELHSYLNVHPFDRDECHGESMQYDAFISSSYSDRTFGISLVHLLESKGYSVCYHEKDFIGGYTIAENICQAIKYSKRVICHITKPFLESAYCMYEFQRALHQNILTKRQRLVVLVDSSLVINQSTLPEDVYQFLSTHTYIEMKTSNNWSKQLFYSLPVNKLGNQQNV